MDYKLIIKDALQQHSFKEPVTEFIRHNENITYKVSEKGTKDAYLLRVHKPITKNMEGVQNTRRAIQSELEFLLAWSDQSKLPVQTPFPSLKGELITTVAIEQEEVPCSVLHWIDGETLSKEDLSEEEAVSSLGTLIAQLHQFSQRYQPESGFIRPEYGIEWMNVMISKLRTGEEMGIYSTEDFQILEQTLLMIIDRMSL